MSDDREKKLALVKRCRDDFAFFAQHCLRIRTKDERTVPLRLNKTQLYIHQRLEDQKQRTGKVRAIIVKGRQQGVSTYVGARFYHRASLHKNVNVVILSHEWQSTDALFDIVDRYHRHNPVAPHVGRDNAKELDFDRLDSHYNVFTAGEKAAGRSRTGSLFHGSEVAMWKNPSEHFAASVQTVPKMTGTEVILESTAKGAAGLFYDKVMDAIAGRGEYELIFAPWFWEETNTLPAPADFEISNEKDEFGQSDQDYMEMWKLTRDQMYWRYVTTQELGSRALFRQEYPADISEAFIASSDNPFIPAHLVLSARKREDIEDHGPLILGADPAGPGGDRFAVAARRGHKVLWVKWRDRIDAMEGAEWLREIAREEKPERINIDSGGLGHGVVSILRSWIDTKDLVHAVDFGSKSQHKMAKPKVPGPKNRRAEMWARLKEWLSLEEGVSLPDMDELQTDIPTTQVKPNTSNDLVLESKDDMRKRGIRSPDLADAIALTFASLKYVPVDKPQPAKETTPRPEPRGDNFINDDPALKVPRPIGGGSRYGWMAS